MSFDLISLMEPLGVALHTANLIEPKFTDTATVFGVGPIGLCMMSILKKMGLKKIFAVDNLEYRVEFAKSFGAFESYVSSDPFVKEIKKLTNGFGTNVCVDTGGTSDSINKCIDVASVGGKMALVGIPDADLIHINPHTMRTKELVIKNVRRSNQTLHDCILHYTDDIEIEKIISHRIQFDNIQEGFDKLSTYSEKIIKCIITNNGNL
jgi:L-iditol 2-dehydrogenase